MPEVLRMNGRKVNFARLAKIDYDPTVRVKWSQKTLYGQTVTGSLRTICHFDRLYTLSLKRFGEPFTVIQPPYNTTVAASAGTHDFDACIDWYIPGIGYWAAQRWGRANGLAGWYRSTNTIWSNHLHGFTLPPSPKGDTNHWDDFGAAGFKVGVYVPGQLVDYYNHAYGLSGQHEPGSDGSWFPPNIKSTIFDLDQFIERRAA